MNLITSLLLLLICARIFGRLFKLLGFQEIIGEILGGLLIGFTSLVTPHKELNGIVELAVFLLIFSAGLEMNLKDIFSALRKRALICALTSFTISFTAGVITCGVLGLNLLTTLVVGLCFAITAMPVVVGFLQNLKIMDTQVGHLIMGSTVLIDIVALLCLGITFDMENKSTIVEFIKTFSIKTIKMAFFFIAIIIVNKFLRSEISRANKTEKVFNRIVNALGKEAIFGMGILFVLVFSTLSESLGFHFIIGAFFGGLLLNKDIIGTNAFLSMSRTLGAMTDHFLTPIFFAYIGLHFSLDAFNEWKLLLLIVMVAFLSKIFGSWLGSRFAKFTNKEALQAGIILNSRGVLDLVVANLAYAKGYISSDIFSVLIFLGISSVIINPFLYRRFISPVPNSPKSVPNSPIPVPNSPTPLDSSKPVPDSPTPPDDKIDSIEDE